MLRSREPRRTRKGKDILPIFSRGLRRVYFAFLFALCLAFVAPSAVTAETYPQAVSRALAKYGSAAAVPVASQRWIARRFGKPESLVRFDLDARMPGVEGRLGAPGSRGMAAGRPSRRAVADAPAGAWPLLRVSLAGFCLVAGSQALEDSRTDRGRAASGHLVAAAAPAYFLGRVAGRILQIVGVLELFGAAFAAPGWGYETAILNRLPNLAFGPVGVSHWIWRGIQAAAQLFGMGP